MISRLADLDTSEDKAHHYPPKDHEDRLASNKACVVNMLSVGFIISMSRTVLLAGIVISDSLGSRPRLAGTSGGFVVY
jgi:hypothetical protein